MYHVVTYNSINSIPYSLFTYFRLYAYFRSRPHPLLFLLLNVPHIKYSMQS